MGRTVSVRSSRYALQLIWLSLILGSTSWILVGSVAYWVKNGWLPADTAGWVQALGGLLGLLIAISVPWYQNRQQNLQLRRKEKQARKADLKREQRENEIALQSRLDGLDATRALIEHLSKAQQELLDCYMQLPIAYHVTGDIGVARSAAHNVKQAAEMLRELSVVSLGVEMVHYMVALREVANYGEFSCSQVDHFILHKNVSPSITKTLQANLRAMREWVAELDEKQVDLLRP
ncbi:hypothetical protein [Pseudomonas sp. GZD-222]|uniref:hypothetical protein n=1 Tax=Pseudomonas sp. GZD-222 TaxID=3404805 RepID=UPI003BB5B533